MAEIESGPTEKATKIKDLVCKSDDETSGIDRARLVLLSSNSIVVDKKSYESSFDPSVKKALEALGVKADGSFQPMSSSGLHMAGFSVLDRMADHEASFKVKCPGDKSERTVKTQDFVQQNSWTNPTDDTNSLKRLVLDSKGEVHDTDKEFAPALKKQFEDKLNAISTPEGKALASKLFDVAVLGASTDDVRELAKATLNSKDTNAVQQAIKAVNATVGNFFELNANETGKLDSFTIHKNKEEFLKFNASGEITDALVDAITKMENVKDPGFFDFSDGARDAKVFQQELLKTLPDISYTRIITEDLNWEPGKGYFKRR